MDPLDAHLVAGLVDCAEVLTDGLVLFLADHVLVLVLGDLVLVGHY